MPSDVERKSRKLREKRKSGNALPSKIVCTAQDAMQAKGGMEIGIVFSLAVLGLYLYGFLESMQALPNVPTGRLLGQNLNLARLQPDIKSIMEDTSSLTRRDTDETRTLAVDDIAVPEGKWPVTTRDEEDDFETIIHPGDHQTEMRVPRFWSPPLHNKKQFTREQAMRVGTCVTPDPVTGSHVRGTDCPVDERTIFVAIASYRDYQCRYTAESIFNRAKNPHRIRIGKFFCVRWNNCSL